MQKSTFKLLFAVLAISLLILPAVTTFNEILTKVVMEVKIYRYLQDLIVPIEAKMVTVILRAVGISAFPTPISVNIGKTTIIGNNVTISWNCIGWQSFILLLITLVTGLQGNFHPWQKIQTVIIGLCGTFLLNLLRMSLVIIIAYRFSPLAGRIFHDYFSTLITIFWLLFFWWFTYSYVLVKETTE